jgi:hypothetical protein
MRIINYSKFGLSGRIQTHDPGIRNPMLCSAELQRDLVADTGYAPVFLPYESLVLLLN